MRDKLLVFLVYSLIFIIGFATVSNASSSNGGGYLTEEGLINSLPLPLDDSFYPYSKSFDDVFADINQNGLGANYYISNELEYFVFYNNSKLYVFFYHPDHTTFSYSINNSYIVFNCTFSNWYYKNFDSVFYVTNALVTITENNGEFNYTYSRSNANLNFDLRLYYEASASTIPTHPEGYHLHGLPCFKTDYNPVINISGDSYNLFEDVPDDIVGGDISVPELPDDDSNKNLFSGIVTYLNKFLSSIKAFFSSLFSELLEFFKSFFGGLFDDILIYLSDIKSGINSVIYGITAIFNYITDTDINLDWENSTLLNFINRIKMLFDFFNFSQFNFNQSNSIVITFDFSKIGGMFSSFGVQSFNFDWFLNVRSYVWTLFNSFLIVRFLWNLINGIPDLVSGLSSRGGKNDA